MRTHIDSCLGVEAVHGANELKESSRKREVYAVRLGEPIELRPALQDAVEPPPTPAHVSITRCFYYCTVLLSLLLCMCQCISTHI